MRAVGGVSRRESTTTRSGWRAVATRRTSSRGSSSRTVPTPVSTAPARLRQAWPSARAASPVIHWLVPSASARAAVERDRRLQAQPRPAALHARDEADVELARLVAAAAPLDGDAGRREPRRAAARDERVRVAQGDDDAADAGGDERVGARRRAAVVRARLERDVDGRAADVDAARGGVAQRHHLGVRAAGFLRVAAADDAAVGADDDAADARVRVRQTPTACAASASASRMGAASVGRRTSPVIACRVAADLAQGWCGSVRRIARTASRCRATTRKLRPSSARADVDVVARRRDVRIDRVARRAARSGRRGARRCRRRSSSRRRRSATRPDQRPSARGVTTQCQARKRSPVSSHDGEPGGRGGRRRRRRRRGAGCRRRR